MTLLQGDSGVSRRAETHPVSEINTRANLKTNIDHFKPFLKSLQILMAAYLKGKIKASRDCYGEFLTWPGYVEKVEAETNTRANSKTNTNDHKHFRFLYQLN